MHINNNSNFQPQFKALYVEKNGMGANASYLAESIATSIEYIDSIDKLDRMGIDTIIIKDDKDSEDRVKVAFIDPQNRLFKIEGKDHIKTIKKYDIGRRSVILDENLDAIVDAAEGIANGRYTKKTSKMTQTLATILKAIPIRSNSFEERAPLSDIGINFEI